MSPLHGLRLNCLLAPLCVAVVAIGGLGLGWQWEVRTARAAEVAGRRAAIVGLARLLEAGGGPDLGSWLAAHRGWSGLARVAVDEEQVVILAQTGAVPVMRDITQPMLLAFEGARDWEDAEGSAVAAPCLPTTGRPSIVVGWYAAPPPATVVPWLLLMAGVVLVGGGLGVYLVVRVYRPVVWMEQAAIAAAAGRAEPPGGSASPETASLRSSLAQLLASRTDPVDGHA